MDVTPPTGQVPENSLLPASVVHQGGGGRNLALRGTGNASVQASSAGVGNTASSSDIVLAVYTLPAGAFDKAGRQLTILAMGSLANNANSKRAKIFFGCTAAVVGSPVSGGTAIADTGASTSANVGWQLEAQVTKTGATGLNTQVSQGTPIVGTTHGGVSVPAALTAVEGAPIIIAVTGSSAASAANDVLMNVLDIAFAN